MKSILYLHAGAEMYGADKILLEIVSGLDKTKFNPIVVLPNNGILVNKLKELGIKTYIIPYPILRRKYFNFRGILQYFMSYRKESKKILDLVKQQHINIIHVNTTAVLEGIFLKKRLKAKLLWHVHEIIVHPKIVHYFIAYLLGKYSDKVVVVSEAVKKHLMKTKLIKSSKIQVAYNGVDENKVDVKDVQYLFDEFVVPKHSIRVGMIGRVNAWKGQMDFLRAVEPILKTHANVHAFLIGGVFWGEEWRFENLKKAIKQSSVASQITLSPFRNDTQSLYKFFDIFVLPSTRPDPLPTVVLEAMAAGKPIVGYRHGGITEMVKQGENGFLANVNDVESLSKNIEKLIDSKKLVISFGKVSLKRQQSLFSKKRFQATFDDIYSSL